MPANAVGNDLASMFIKQTQVNQKKSNSLGLDDFVKLIAAQIQNQDMMNPLSDTEFLAQMAQFSALQTQQDIMSLNLTTYTVGLIGKDITVARIDKQSGALISKTGAVTGVGLYDGEPVIFIGDERYSLGEIMIVGRPPNSDVTPEAEDTTKADETPQTNNNTPIADSESKTDTDDTDGTDKDGE
ncbi:MAG: hypothetical protein FWH14_03160 [Oscillospiraceae bacterium]|nr:hypothetical protein [Oscillospiraceae bacterium]